MDDGQSTEETLKVSDVYECMFVCVENGNAAVIFVHQSQTKFGLINAFQLVLFQRQPRHSKFERNFGDAAHKTETASIEMPEIGDNITPKTAKNTTIAIVFISYRFESLHAF